MQFRAGTPQLLPFLRRMIQNWVAKEKPELGDRMVFCIYWDFFIVPIRFWTDDAVAGLLSTSGLVFNLDKVRNMRRELGLKPARPAVVRQFKSLPGTDLGEPAQIFVELDDDAASRAGLSAMLQALLVFLKCPPLPRS
jgi:hypothetical protein